LPAPSEPALAHDAADNTVFAEVLGNGLLYSINYERRVVLSGIDLGLRGGASFFTYKVAKDEGTGNLTLATFPLVVSAYFGPPRHKLQLGIGATWLYVSTSTDNTGTKFSGGEDGLGLAATAVVGYRYVPPGGGFTFGAGFTPLVRTGKGVLAWGGLSGGYAF
jgi:hypothetical protein